MWYVWLGTKHKDKILYKKWDNKTFPSRAKAKTFIRNHASYSDFWKITGPDSEEEIDCTGRKKLVW